VDFGSMTEGRILHPQIYSQNDKEHLVSID